ncbi:hypothetical protein [Bacteroides pyogenes]|uniref:hypothetical protein n=1 Tax=Bacteroides pyogenes TaxID=310300 RepID=UPI00048543DD|nr:hypothetical protein [Bacteroides pyogenes]
MPFEKKAAGFEKKAAGFEKKAAGFEKKAAGFEKKAGRCVVMHDALPFLFIAIQIGSLSLSCDILKISLIYVFPALK